MNKINILIKPPQEKLKSLLEYFQSGRYGDAEKLSLSITKEFPEHQFAWKILAAVLKQTGRINESLNIIQKSIQLNPQDSTNHNNLGVILQELNRVDEAQACFGKAIKLQPEYAEAHCNLGLILHVLRNFEEAQRSYKQAIGLKHDYAEAYNGLGNLQREIGKSDEFFMSLYIIINIFLIFLPSYEICSLGSSVPKLRKRKLLSFISTLDKTTNKCVW